MTAAEIEGGNNVQAEKKLKFEEKKKFTNAIANPLASKKLNKKLIKLMRKASTNSKKNLRIGLKDVQRYVKKGETGLMIFAGDVSPIDIMSHMPGVCEEKNIPYCYIPSQKDLAVAVGFTNSCLMALVKEGPEYQDLYDECRQDMKKLVYPM